MGFRIDLAALLCSAGMLSSCGNSDFYSNAFSKGDRAHINNKVKFSQSAYGVAASPRVTVSRKVRKGGGRRQIGRPYKIKGKWYTPQEDFDYDRIGQASWYGPNFHGRLTANGEIYDQYALTAAHPTFPLPSYARVTNLTNGRSIIVRVNDRGPYHEGRIIDLSAKASEMLDYQRIGVARVRVQYIKQAPLHGRDHKQLLASYSGSGTAKKSNPGLLARLTGNLSDGSLSQPSNLTTGSVSEPESDGDPFVAELKAVRARKDTGSTFSLRMKQLLAGPKQ